MCVSAAPADFTGTVIFLNRIQKIGLGEVTIVAYQNKAQNLHSGPNAMLLHFPAMPMGRNNNINTDGCPNFLDDMVRALTPRSRGISTLSFGSKSIAPRVEVFDTGIYTVVLAQNAADIPGALYRVPEHKRPPMNRELFNYYSRECGDWPVALCCFDNRDAVKATPIMFWYQQLHNDRMHAPAIDCHTGGVPSYVNPVDVDHWIIVGSNEKVGARVDYTGQLTSNLRAILPRYVIGKYFFGTMVNGDFVSPMKSVTQGSMEGFQRLLPSAM